TPKPPARWPNDESTQITKSRHFMRAAVSMKGPEASSMDPSSVTGKRPAIGASCSLPNPFCALMRVTPGTRATGSNQTRRFERSQRGMAADPHPANPRPDQRRIANELHGVAQPLFVVEQDGAACQGGAVPGRLRKGDGPELVTPAPLVLGPALLVISLPQPDK